MMMEINEEDLQVDIIRQAQPGGPVHLRLTHRPTGIATVSIRHSVLRAKAEALKLLRGELERWENEGGRPL